MRKFLAVFLTAILCVSLVSSAWGEATLTQVYQYQAGGGISLINGSNNVVIGGYDGRAMASLDGTPLTEKIYRSFYFEKGFYVVELPEGMGTGGAVNAEGQVVIPCRYHDVDILSDTWATAVIINENGTKEDHDYTIIGSGDSKYGLIETVDLYNLKEGKVAATLDRDHFMQARAQGEYLNIVDRSKVTNQYDGAFNLVAENVSYYSDFPNEKQPDYTNFYEDGLYGVKDAEGNVVIPAKFDYVEEIRDGLVRVKVGDLKGVADLATGELVVPAEYDGLDWYSGGIPNTYEGSPFSAFGYVSVKKDKKVGYYSLADGALTAELKYGSDDGASNYGISMLRKADGQFWIYAADGTEVQVEGAEYCFHLDYSMGRYYKYTNSEYKTGLVDWHGEEVLPAVYSSIELSADGRYLLTYDDETDTATVYELSDQFVSWN